MGTTTTTQTSNQYNPASMNAYNAFQPQLMSSLMSMAQNPLGSSYFQNQLGQNMAFAHQLTNRNNQNVIRNLRTGGGILSNGGAFVTGLMNRNALAGANTQANAFNSALDSALKNRNTALMAMQAYQPLQTGQNSTQSTGGLGTWLPQLAGAAMNMAMPGIGSMLGGGSFSGGYGGPGQMGGSSPGWGGRPASGSMSPQLANPWTPPQTGPYGYA